MKVLLGHRRQSLCCLETQNAPPRNATWRHWQTPSDIFKEKRKMGHPILQLAKTTRGLRAARARRSYKLSSLDASRLASLWRTVTVGHFHNENVWRMVYASYQLILDFETKAEYQVEYGVLKAKQRTEAKTISLSSLGSGSKLEQSHQQWAAYKGCQSSHST